MTHILTLLLRQVSVDGGGREVILDEEVLQPVRPILGLCEDQRQALHIALPEVESLSNFPIVKTDSMLLNPQQQGHMHLPNAWQQLLHSSFTCILQCFTMQQLHAWKQRGYIRKQHNLTSMAEV